MAAAQTNEGQIVSVPGVVLLRQPDVRVEGVALRGSPDERGGGEALPVGPVQALLGLVQAQRGGPHAHPVRVRVVLAQLGPVHALHGPAGIFDGESVRLLRRGPLVSTPGRGSKVFGSFLYNLIENQSHEKRPF